MNLHHFASTLLTKGTLTAAVVLGLGATATTAFAQYNPYQMAVIQQQRMAAMRQAQAIDQALRRQEIQVSIDPRSTAGLSFEQRAAFIEQRKQQLAGQAQANLSQICEMVAEEINAPGTYARYRSTLTFAKDVNACKAAGFPIPSGPARDGSSQASSNGFPNEAMQKDLNTYIINGANTSYSDYGGKNRGPGTGAR